jgi:hypothetical protein
MSYLHYSERTSQHGTQSVKTHNRGTQNTKIRSRTDPIKKLGVNSGARVSKMIH